MKRENNKQQQRTTVTNEEYVCCTYISTSRIDAVAAISPWKISLKKMSTEFFGLMNIRVR